MPTTHLLGVLSEVLELVAGVDGGGARHPGRGTHVAELVSVLRGIDRREMKQVMRKYMLNYAHEQQDKNEGETGREKR